VYQIYLGKEKEGKWGRRVWYGRRKSWGKKIKKINRKKKFRGTLKKNKKQKKYEIIGAFCLDVVKLEETTNRERKDWKRDLIEQTRKKCVAGLALRRPCEQNRTKKVLYSLLFF